MDLGVMSLDGLVSSSSSDPEQKHKWYGSGFLKQQRSVANTSEDELMMMRSSKLAKTNGGDDDDMSSAACKAMMFFNQRNCNNSSSLRSNATLFSDAQHQQQMLSFSSPKSDTFLLDKPPQNVTLPYAYHPLPSYTRNTGYNSGSMHVAFNGSRGAFTPSQWMELEHQALIYKYITANVPVPPHLLIPIRKALESAGFSNFTNGLLRPNALGWGGFHLGYSNNTDPEPGRCRRTDGKKWRCSRDAVVDQKYCERHMNRGRHRSRKHVEGQSGGLALTGNNINNTTTAAAAATPPSGSNSKQLNAAAASPSSMMVTGNSASNNLNFAHQEQPKMMHNLLAPDNVSAANNINRMFMNNKENQNETLPMLPPTLELKQKENHPFMMQKQNNSFDESLRNNEFGFVTSDSLLNPSQKASTTLLSSNSRSSSSFGSSNTTNRDTASQQHSLRHFIDDCPKPHSNPHQHHRPSSVSWPELDMMQSDRTQLSISIPMTSSDFMSFTTSSPNNDKLTLSPLKLSREFELDPIQMGLGVGNTTATTTTAAIATNLNNESNISGNTHTNTNTNASSTRQGNWIPISWENSMGGPLGEVLHLSSINYNGASSDHNSPSMGSSPTGVLQKTAFGSLSNSSAGSSPRAENNHKNQEGASFCNDNNNLLGSTLGIAASFTP